MKEKKLFQKFFLDFQEEVTLKFKKGNQNKCSKEILTVNSKNSFETIYGIIFKYFFAGRISKISFNYLYRNFYLIYQKSPATKSPLFIKTNHFNNHQKSDTQAWTHSLFTHRSKKNEKFSALSFFENFRINSDLKLPREFTSKTPLISPNMVSHSSRLASRAKNQILSVKSKFDSSN